MDAKNIGVILAGGVGARLSKEHKKQYIEINGRECISYVINAFLDAQSIDAVLVVENKEQFLEGHVEKKYGLPCAQGGDTRNLSIASGIAYIRQHYPHCEKVFFHDSARPMIRADIINDIMALLDTHTGVITAQPITDGLGCKTNTPADRTKFYLSQTPEAFRFPVFAQYFDAQSNTVALSHHLPEDADVFHYAGFPYNLKMTYPEDIYLAELLLGGHFPQYLATLPKR